MEAQEKRFDTATEYNLIGCTTKNDIVRFMRCQSQKSCARNSCNWRTASRA